MTQQHLFTRCLEEITGEYSRLNHTLGYRFLLGPRSTLSPETDILFLGLNPGGAVIPPEHPCDSCENGPAFFNETWNAGAGRGNSALQLQVRSMLRDLAGKMPGAGDSRQLMTRSLLAYYIPFRSPDFAGLPYKASSREFSRRLWSGILREIDPRLIICINNETFADISAILTASRGLEPQVIRSGVGWGNISAELALFNSRKRRTSLLRFPHLSRFRIFGHSESLLYTDRLLQLAVSFSLSKES
ncbi:MAG: hypothetical protein SCH71_15955 [Desulfobulbaceae bacterium]|nr:hypothetical protein [Desulfobulbaceae bacterium]